MIYFLGIGANRLANNVINYRGGLNMDESHSFTFSTIADSDDMESPETFFINVIAMRTASILTPRIKVTICGGMCVCLSLCLSVGQSVYLSVCLSVCLSVHPSNYQSICLSACLSIMTCAYTGKEVDILGIRIRSEGLAQADDELGRSATWYIHIHTKYTWVCGYIE